MKTRFGRLATNTRAKSRGYSPKFAVTPGETLNVNSPKQLSELLFDKLMLASGRKTSTGRSTNAEVLEGLRDEHPVVPLILEYRKYAKLKNTYIDALLRLRGADGRIHSSFDQVAHRDRTHQLARPEPSKHSDSNATGPGYSASVHRATGLAAGGRGLFAD